jgi:23S rRNA (cytosine1962-C5)-methyltransferase
MNADAVGRAEKRRMPTLRLKRPLERAVRSGHPWLYRDALEAHDLPPSTAVRIASKDGRVVGVGLTDSGPIGVRVWRTEDKPIDAALVRERITQALALRAQVIRGSALEGATNAYRLVHGEGDRLPGIVCDRYADVAVLRFDAAGESVASVRAWLLAALQEALPALGVTSLIERSTRKADGSRVIFGELPPQPMRVVENGMQLAVHVVEGQKTGLFLDQREARARVRSMAAGASVLNLYGYTGGFSIAAALGGARAVTTVDIAAPALALAERTFELNGLSRESSAHKTVAADVPAFLGELAQSGSRFDLVIADPPNFAPSEAALDAALASYANLHALALAAVSRGGYYLAGSCSSHVSASAFLETLRAGAQKARRIVQVLDQHGAPPDHPRLLAFPEGDYLKVVLARVW